MQFAIILTMKCKISCQLAREQAQTASNSAVRSESDDTSKAADGSLDAIAASTPTNAAAFNTSTASGIVTSPLPVTPLVATTDSPHLAATSTSQATITSSASGIEPSMVADLNATPTAVAGRPGAAAAPHDSTASSGYQHAVIFLVFLVF